ncbi:DUF3810 domain-containing protein [Sphingobacterium corticibacter]|uniref:DUF3810 domain-containing protein n=1 Tax=Sphingobacterium corticibacter TaxID=2171749 RepID=A0A2T8HI31_9SPHI|nr:DUF3810 domain-containing protein [Sphingobacterium corticibacter]PVH25107.1 DUF3810 domain-containing protein [Sphingobacterium corticibacter]
MRSAGSKNRLYFWIIGVCVVLGIIGYVFVQDPARVEWLYSRNLYPLYSYLPTILFSWLPFSLGDLFYGFAVIGLLLLFVRGIRFLILKKWEQAGRSGLQFVCTILLLHHIFYMSWGLNYYRQPLAMNYALDVANISTEDYEIVLDSLIRRANVLRQQVDVQLIANSRNMQPLEHVMLADTTFNTILSKKHISAKHPVSSTLASYFTVNGYFNPFTHEVQVNALIPWPSFPFTVAHELSHQMGIGFEDECNFIAYQVLSEHPNPWYAYSAHYAAVQSLLGAMRYAKPQLFNTYFRKLDPAIVRDLQSEQDFWSNYSGPVNYISGIIYNHYLQHNNQPEGTQRYSMMNRLIVAWYKKENIAKR